MNPRTVGALAILMLLGRPALAQTRAEALSSLYDDATLRYWQGRYEISTCASPNADRCWILLFVE